MSACVDQEMLLHALFDGELDAANSLAVETHLRACAGCAAELTRLAAVREAVGQSSMKHRAPLALYDRIVAQIDGQSGNAAPSVRKQRSIRPWLAGGISSIAASLLLLVAVPQVTAMNMEDQVIASHVRSLLANHIIDIATSDQHVVKPWFNGRIDFAPPVVDLADHGFPLAGGRLDYLDGRVVPALVYHRRLHSINLFIRPVRGISSPLSITAKRNGYSLVRWTRAGLEYWAVSDIGSDELDLFKRDFDGRIPS